MQILEAINNNLILSIIGVPGVLCVIVVLFNKDHQETSSLALLNTLATVVLTAVNIAALFFLLDPIEAVANWVYGLANIPKLSSTVWDSTPWWVAVPVIFLAFDLSEYAIHRIMHRKWFWPAHAAHHSDTHVNAFTAYRVHFLESFLMAITWIFLFTWLNAPGLLPATVMVNYVWVMYVHMDVPWDHGRLRYIIASPVYHRWHHADTAAAHGKNLANKFPFVDMMFGTFYDASAAEVSSVPMGAKASNISDINPLKLVFYPVAQWGRLVREQVRSLAPTPAPAVVSERDHDLTVS